MVVALSLAEVAERAVVTHALPTDARSSRIALSLAAVSMETAVADAQTDVVAGAVSAAGGFGVALVVAVVSDPALIASAASPQVADTSSAAGLNKGIASIRS